MIERTIRRKSILGADELRYYASMRRYAYELSFYDAVTIRRVRSIVGSLRLLAHSRKPRRVSHESADKR